MLPSHNWRYNSASGLCSRTDFNNRLTHRIQYSPVGFTEHTDTLHVDVDVIHPWGTALDGYPLAGVVHLGNTTFLGDNRDALGFSTLWSVGYALQLDVSRRNWSVQSVKLGFNYLVGDEDVEGYEIVLGYRF